MWREGQPTFIVTNHLLDVIQTLSRSQPIHTTPSTKRILRQCHNLYLVSKIVAISSAVPLENYLAPLQQFVQPTLVHTSEQPSSKILNLYGMKELGIRATRCSGVRVPDFFPLHQLASVGHRCKMQQELSLHWFWHTQWMALVLQVLCH